MCRQFWLANKLMRPSYVLGSPAGSTGLTAYDHFQPGTSTGRTGSVDRATLRKKNCNGSEIFQRNHCRMLRRFVAM